MKKNQNLAHNTIKDIWRSLEKYVFPYIGNTPIDTLTARRFVEILTPIKARGNLETLKRVLQRINEVMDFAANSGLIDINTAANVRKAFPSPHQKAHANHPTGTTTAANARFIDRQHRTANQIAD